MGKSRHCADWCSKSVWHITLYCPTASGLIVVSVIDGTDVASYTTYDNCTAVAILIQMRFYTSHLATKHQKSLVMGQWVVVTNW